MNHGKLVLPNRTTSKLKCDLCYGYLSVAPIYSYRDKYACGRCNPEWERNVIYEQLAQYMIFPCMYCEKSLVWESVKAHEDKCKQNKLLCPKNTSDIYQVGELIRTKNGGFHKECDDRIIRCPFQLCLNTYEVMNILQHFNKFHKEYIFTNTVEGKKIFKEEKIWNFDPDTNVCLIVLNTIPFLLFVHNHCEFDDNTGDILFYNYYFSVFTFCLQTCDMKYTVNLQIQHDNSEIPITRTMKNQEIKTFNDKIHSVIFLRRDFLRLTSFDFMTTKFNRIERKEKLVLNYSVKIVDTNIKMTTAKYDDKEELLNLFGIEKNAECPICKEYMSPPIYNCNTGHSICRNCKEKLTVCPYCQALMRNSRNYALEDIVEKLLLRCHNEHQGCSFTGKVQEIKLHEGICPYN